jgi:hypothetical protein
MTKRTPPALQFARLARQRLVDNNPGAARQSGVSFFAGFAMGLGYCRLVGVPSVAEQEAVSGEALRLTTPEREVEQ